MSTPTNGRQITISEAINEAIREEMRRDETVVLLGEDVAAPGGVLKVTQGILDEFGPSRVIDTPISEAGFTGLAVGGAVTGIRPIVEIMFGDFMTLSMDQLVNQAAKIHYMSGGEIHGSARRSHNDGSRPVAPPRSIRRVCKPGSRTYPASRSHCLRRPMTPRGCSRRRSVTTTPSCFLKTR